MHRRATHSHTVAAGNADPVVATTNTTMKKRRKGISRQLKRSRDLAMIEDVVLTIIQVVCVCTLIGCGVLWLKQLLPGSFFSSSEAKYHTHKRVKDLKPLEPSSIYTIPHSMVHIGDKTDGYATLRKEFDQYELPSVPQKYSFSPMPMTTLEENQEAYDIFNCPARPPKGYPFAHNLLEIVTAWPPDDPTPPTSNQIYQGLCVFDFKKDFDKAMAYRKAELPFVVKGDPAVEDAVKRWNAPGYMNRLMGNVRHRAEYSENNHFMYWNAPKKGNRKPEMKDWKEPTEMIRMTYADWLRHANVTDDMVGPDMEHWYFRLIGCGETGPKGECDKGSSEYLFDELTFFQPKESLYITDPAAQKGIHCRFGMKGVIAENHFDGSRNMIAVLGGERRYILSHPEECPNLSLYPKGHPSARHSAVDWSNPDLKAYPEFAQAKANEVVLQAGDVLYLPTNWFHYIISLSLNYQCNTRSGISQDYMRPIHECGF